MSASSVVPQDVHAESESPEATKTLSIHTPEITLSNEDLDDRAEEQRQPIQINRTLADLAIEAGVRCFVDQTKSSFALIPVEAPTPHVECLPLASKAFLGRLDELLQTIPSIAGCYQLKDLQKAVKQLELFAVRSGRKRLESRLTSEDQQVLVDLGDEQWQMIAVDKVGWSVVPQRRPHFFRPAHQRPLVNPVAGGSVDELFEFTPVNPLGDQLLLLAWLLSAFVLWVPSPILLLTGSQGSGKTTRSRWLRSLVDPSEVPVLGEIEMRQLVQTFAYHAVACFENVSTFNRPVSDQFCRAVTGDGVERRKLYTDSDSVLYSFRRAILINGLTIPSERPDFLDRSIVLEFNRPAEFKTASELDQAFKAASGRILGALLDLLVKTFGLLESMPPASEFRMADFARFGRAVAVALGRTTHDFDTAYRDNIRRVRQQLLEEHLLGRLLREFATSFTESRPWTGIVSELLDSLCSHAKRKGLPRVESELTKSKSKLSRELEDLQEAFLQEGIVLKRLKRTSGKRAWEIFAQAPPSTVNVAAIQHRLEGGNNG
ncbi:MAG: hypothetical protein JNL18_18080 [Planctomycetaceae bacterium]|nr:hypothetical protein [Planctomycetaceae bacterium]